MRIILIIVGVILFFPIIGFGLYVFDLIYYEKMSYKAEKAALIYLENKYHEEFEVDKAEYSLPLGDDMGWYTIDAHPVDNPEICIRLDANEDYKIDSDNYKEMKWRNDAIILYRNKIQPIIPNLGSMYVDQLFSKEISNKYNLYDTYQLIFKENPKIRDEYFHLLIFEDKQTFHEEKELKRLFQLLEMIKARQLENYTVVVEYYPNEITGKVPTYKDLNDFENENRQNLFFYCHLANQSLVDSKVSTYQDLAKLCRR